MKNLGITIICMLVSLALSAQTGILKGSLIDKTTQEAIIGGNVLILETNGGTVTEWDGSFEIELVEGLYTVQFTYVGYKTVEIKEVEIRQGDETTLQYTMEEESEILDEVVIIAKRDRTSANILLLERKESVLLTQAIGAQELSIMGIGDASEGLKKVVGLSVQGSKFVVVRGLGDRYNSSMLNGFPVASPNPDKRILPYDIFPSSVLNNLSVNKSFSPDYYGNFAGAAVNIETRDYPEESFLKVNLGTTYNSQVTFNEFMSDPEADNDILGFNTTRQIPSIIKDFYNENPNQFVRSNSLGQANESNFFNTSFDPEFITAMPSVSMGATYGGKIDLNNDKQSFIGVLANVNYSKTYTNNFGNIRIINKDEFIRDFEFNKDAISDNLSGVLNLAYLIDRHNTITFKNIFTHSTDNSVLETAGFFSDTPNDVYSRRITYKDFQLLANQLAGEHQLNPNMKMDWGLSYSNAIANEPDRRQIAFFYNDSNENSNFYQLNRSDVAESHRFFTTLNDNDMAAKADYYYFFDSNNKKSNYLKGGVNLRYKVRDFELHQYNYDFAGLTDEYDIYNIDDQINIANFNNGLYSIDEGTTIQDRYDAQLSIIAPYLSGSWQSTEKLNISGGLRVEISNQFIEYANTLDEFEGFEPLTKNEISAIDLMPSLIFKYDFNENHIGRLSTSRTISRPDFREMSPFEYRESFGALRNIGNPDLKNASNYNLDARYEYIPVGGELIALGAFYKYLDQPIVQFVEVGATRVSEYGNAVNASVLGAEIELRKSLNFISESMSDFVFSTNVTAMYSNIKLEEDAGSNSNQTNNERPLQGASPYIVNLDLTYRKVTDKLDYNFAVTYNTFGRRLRSVGTLGTGDIFESPVNTLNFSLGASFGTGKKWSAKLGVQNILNPSITTRQDILDDNNNIVDEILLDNYTRGVNVSLGLSYRIF